MFGSIKQLVNNRLRSEESIRKLRYWQSGKQYL